MQIHYNIETLPVFKNAIITIGTFDGVHMGHRQIIDKMKEEAKANQGESVIITFHPHPRKVVSSTILGVRLINTNEEKLELLEQAGIDHVVVVPFTDAFANQPAEDYISNFLIDKFHPHTIIIGYDHRFGRERTGDYRLLEKKSTEYGFRLIEIPKHILENISISSTNIREAILHSDIATADSLLGYEFFFSGQVVHGDKLGRQLGYPTANLKVLNEEKITPGNGIYAVYAELPDVDEYVNSPLLKPHSRLKGMMSIGFRPTVDGKKRVIEVNIFNFNEDIYDQMLKVYVKKYLRAEIKFDGLEALIKQIDQDKIDSLEVL
ncbi:MAG: Riboflavin biosynthesis protein RibF [Bacteroidetes bacterium ADurb.BinA245]|jgi:riboflavin kinase/FMN adenylyltransferase|nr:bifunctional riboflavin kinase/FAD synthetase [Chitinophagaceae bacterium]OPZ18868.1 MAG: Riboflavin biosynthesis protein RibF [Bacteroidetes bacterium ADurb.BinA245]HMW66637.1 bifunctional riboflavin kinase/FAD synthetase [Chitinophagaceae bacterium]HND94635.1 bifunctional riboflavin kinase/FAD synthetase [Chitinophagaceae bacterium]HNJ25496.1 bifunctional riboflavin kinase/FAD synthetase [Chitinophagaceae bacterium]